jgi:hypothetical protein
MNILVRNPGRAALWARHVLLLLLSAMLLASRHPGGVLHPTLWAEDGKMFFEHAYLYGLKAFLRPHTGYLQSFPRLVALLGRLVPITWLPAWFMIAGFAMQMAPVGLVLWRGAEIIPSAWARAALILFYLGMPNSQELFLHLTDAQWHFGLVLFLLVVLAPPQGWAGRWAQYAALVLGGLSGPFSVILAPLAWWQAAETMPAETMRAKTLGAKTLEAKPLGAERSQAVIQAALLSVTACVQGALVIIGGAAARDPTPLGASVMQLARILADQVFWGGMIGSKLVGQLQPDPWWRDGAVPAAMALLGMAVVTLAFWRGPGVYRKFSIFAGLILAAGLISPVISIGKSQWAPLDFPGIGCRYYFFAIMAWFAGVLVLAGQRNPGMRYAARFLLPCFLIGVAVDWRYDFAANDVAARYHQAAKMFQRAAPGSLILFPADPAEIWMMKLVKH